MTQSRFPLLLSLGLSPGVVFSTGQQSECAEGHTCFSLQVNLPMEPGGDREEFKRLSNTRYQVQERECTTSCEWTRRCWPLRHQARSCPSATANLRFSCPYSPKLN